MKIHGLLLAAAFLPVALAAQEDRYAQITNPKLTSINKEPPRSTFTSYTNEADAVVNDRKNGTFRISLNGKWKFNYVENFADRPTDFMDIHADVSKWPDIDVPAGDMGVGGREIGYLYGQYRRLKGVWENGVLTGKGLSYGGSLIRPEATGYGAIYYLQEVLKHENDTIEGKRIAISGYGNVGWGIMKKASQLGAKVTYFAGPDGYIHDPDGIKLDIIKDIKLVNCHLGNGSSLSAVKDGKCQDTSMGLTPLAGVPMGTRSGDIDPAVVQFVMNKYGMSADECLNMLNKKSGVLALSGTVVDITRNYFDRRVKGKDIEPMWSAFPEYQKQEEAEAAAEEAEQEKAANQ